MAARTSSSVAPGASSSSRNRSPAGSSTASSVTIRVTQPRAVSGRAQRRTSFGAPLRSVWSVVTITRGTRCASSIAPPTPGAARPGTRQFARSPRTSVSNAPSTHTPTRPARTSANEVTLSRYAAPGSTVT